MIIDEFEGELPLRILLRMLDGHPLKMEIKGGYTHPVWEQVIITSNHHPLDWYPNADEHKRGALLRRLTEIKEFSE